MCLFPAFPNVGFGRHIISKQIASSTFENRLRSTSTIISRTFNPCEENENDTQNSAQVDIPRNG